MTGRRANALENTFDQISFQKILNIIENGYYKGPTPVIETDMDFIGGTAAMGEDEKLNISFRNPHSQLNLTASPSFLKLPPLIFSLWHCVIKWTMNLYAKKGCVQ